jgi:hypothetical protein
MIALKYNSSGTLLWKTVIPISILINSTTGFFNNRISGIGYGGSSPGAAYFDWKTFQTDTDGTLLWSAIYNAKNFNDEEPYHVLAKPTGEFIVNGGPSPDPNNPSFIQMPIIEYSNTGSQIWMDTPNIYGGWGLASMFASDASLYAISSSDMTVYHYSKLCNSTVLLENIIVSEDTVIEASNIIQLFNVSVINSANLTLKAPTVKLAGNCIFGIGSTVYTFPNGCTL